MLLLVPIFLQPLWFYSLGLISALFMIYDIVFVRVTTKYILTFKKITSRDAFLSKIPLSDCIGKFWYLTENMCELCHWVMGICSFSSWSFPCDSSRTFSPIHAPANVSSLHLLPLGDCRIFFSARQNFCQLTPVTPEWLNGWRNVYVQYLLAVLKLHCWMRI